MSTFDAVVEERKKQVWKANYIGSETEADGSTRLFVDERRVSERLFVSDCGRTMMSSTSRSRGRRREPIEICKALYSFKDQVRY